MSRRLRLILALAAAAVLAVGLIYAVSTTTSTRHRSRVAKLPAPPALAAVPRGAAVVSVGPGVRGRPIPAGFLGLSLEFPAVEAYAGSKPAVLEQLIRNLAPDQAPVLRIGGDSTDWTWWPVRGVPKPPGVTFTLGKRWLAVTHEIAQALGAHLILGINLEANSSAVAATEAREMLAGIGSQRIEGFELGNEPELYPNRALGWYRAPDGAEVPGRPPDYDFAAFKRNFAGIAVAALPRLPVAGPAIGAPKWMAGLDQLIADGQRLSVVTLHRYPLQQCYVSPGAPNYPTIHNLFSAAASEGLANSVARYVALAHKNGLQLRIDEMNSVSCGRGTGVSNVFASALWALDASFQMARVGVDGVNFHTYPNATYRLFTFRRVRGSWQAFVYPEYYGLLMFAQAAPAGSRLLRVSAAGLGRVRVWATRDLDGHTRIVLINDSTVHSRVVAIRIPGASADATLERLTAMSVRATDGVEIGGQTFGAETATGALAGASRITPVTEAIGGDLVVRLPAVSAALVTVT
jgi:hypothetical protein